MRISGNQKAAFKTPLILERSDGYVGGSSRFLAIMGQMPKSQLHSEVFLSLRSTEERANTQTNRNADGQRPELCAKSSESLNLPVDTEKGMN